MTLARSKDTQDFAAKLLPVIGDIRDSKGNQGGPKRK